MWEERERKRKEKEKLNVIKVFQQNKILITNFWVEVEKKEILSTTPKKATNFVMKDVETEETEESCKGGERENIKRLNYQIPQNVLQTEKPPTCLDFFYNTLSSNLVEEI